MVKTFSPQGLVDKLIELQKKIKRPLHEIGIKASFFPGVILNNSTSTKAYYLQEDGTFADLTSDERERLHRRLLQHWPNTIGIAIDTEGHYDKKLVRSLQAEWSKRIYIP